MEGSRGILIITHPQDLHAFLVQEALAQKGHTVDLLHTSDFPQRSSKAVLEEQTHLFRGPDMELRDLRPEVVWWRRPVSVTLPDWLHPNDTEFARSECRHFFSWFWEALSDSGFWVNPYASRLRSENKILQQRAALRAGLEVPPTLYSNDPMEILRFIRGNGGEVVYKPLRPHNATWREDNRVEALYTSLLTEDLLPDEEILALTPGIFQQHVRKKHELRVVVFGSEIFAAKIKSQQTVRGKLDFRAAYDELSLEPAEIPPYIEKACLSILDQLGIVTGSFDLIVTPEDRYVFLEVNPQGQFLWVEAYTGQPILDTFCEFLIRKGRVPEQREVRPQIRLTEVETKAFQRQERAQAEHVLAYPPEAPPIKKAAS